MPKSQLWHLQGRDRTRDDRMHGRDERLKIDAYYTVVEFYYLFLKALTTPAG